MKPLTSEQQEAANKRSRKHRKNNLEKVRKTAREWRNKNRESANKSTRKWYHNNPDKAKNHSLRRNHGITLDDLNRMLRTQEGLCAICGGAMKKPCVDHDHATGKIRELLCHPCNIALGMLRDSPELARKAAAYLEKHSETALTTAIEPAL